MDGLDSEAQAVDARCGKMVAHILKHFWSHTLQHIVKAQAVDAWCGEIVAHTLQHIPQRTLQHTLQHTLAGLVIASSNC